MAGRISDVAVLAEARRRLLAVQPQLEQQPHVAAAAPAVAAVPPAVALMSSGPPVLIDEVELFFFLIALKTPNITKVNGTFNNMSNGGRPVNLA